MHNGNEFITTDGEGIHKDESQYDDGLSLFKILRDGDRESNAMGQLLQRASAFARLQTPSGLCLPKIEFTDEGKTADFSTTAGKHSRTLEFLPELSLIHGQDGKVAPFRQVKEQEKLDIKRQEIANQSDEDNVYDKLIAQLSLLPTEDGRVFIPAALVGKRMESVPWLTVKSDLGFKMRTTEDGGIVFQDVTGLSANLPIPAELLDRLGADKEGGISKIAIGAPDNKGNRAIHIEFSKGQFKSLRLVANKDGQPVLNDGKLEITAQFEATNGQTLDCHIKLPGKADAKQEVTIQPRGDADAKIQLVQNLGIPSELAAVAKNITTISISERKLQLELSEPTSLNANGLCFRFDRNVTVSDETRSGLGANDKDFALSGIQVSGVNFEGMTEVSNEVNALLEKLKAMPIKLKALSTRQSDNGEYTISFSSSSGGIRAGEIRLTGKDNPKLISCELDVIHPVIRSRSTRISVDQNGVKNPLAIAEFAFFTPVEEGATFGMWLASQYKDKALTVARGLKNDPAGTIRRGFNESKELLNKGVDTATGAAGDATRFAERKGGEVKNFIIKGVDRFIK
jgi:hypothetical protein